MGFVCGSCGVKHETFDDLEACLNKESTLIDSNSSDESTKSATEDEKFMDFATYETKTKTEVVFHVNTKINSDELTSNSDKYKSHPDKKLFYCDNCSYSTNFKDHLKRHMRIHILHCSKCNISFESSIRLRQHNVALHIEKLSMFCFYCPMKFSYNDLKQKHMRENHASALKNQCSTCKYICSDKFNLERHSKQCKVYKCSECKYSSRFKRDFNRHTQKHKTTCSKCNISFDSWADLLQHNAATHEEKLAHTCPHCPMSFVYPSSKQKHIRDSHPEALEFQCTNCNYVLKNKEQFERHASLCKRLECSFCAYSCRYKDKLERHMTTHRRKLAKAKNQPLTQPLPSNPLQLPINVATAAETSNSGINFHQQKNRLCAHSNISECSFECIVRQKLLDRSLALNYINNLMAITTNEQFWSLPSKTLE